MTAPPTRRAHRFWFATGIENSYPTIAGPDGGARRVDEMAKAGHYARWREDFALVRELGIDYLRYGPPYYRVHLAPDRYDWEFADETFAELRRLGIRPIVDLCHFGVPDWIGGFQDPDWPRLFAEYAGAFAERFPWVRRYTPVNEIIIAALFSALYGWWNERQASERAFVTALVNLVRANLLAQEAILRVVPRALFVQSESSEHFHPESPAGNDLADLLNLRRFLSLDLCYGHDLPASAYSLLLDNGLARADYEDLRRLGRRFKKHCVMGNDYYVTNEHLVHDDGTMEDSGEIYGYYIITKAYYERYHLPVMHTETNNRDGGDGVVWLRKQWANMLRLREDGVPIVGFTWYSLTDQVDWDTLLREDNGRVNPFGLYDLDRRIRPVGRAYARLVEQWRDILPGESLSIEIEDP